MKKEMIKFVSENFEVIKNNFYESEKDAILDCDDCDESDIDNLEIDLEDIEDAESLIEVINERSIGANLEDESEIEELFDMIKELKEAAN